MKKLVLMLCTIMSASALADSNVNFPVPNNGVLSAKGGSVVMTTNGIGIPGVRYNITCHVNTPDVMLINLIGGYMCMPTFSVNGKYYGYPQVVSFSKGDNIVVFSRVCTGTHQMDENYANFGFTNMDNTLSATVSNCSGTPTN